MAPSAPARQGSSHKDAAGCCRQMLPYRRAGCRACSFPKPSRKPRDEGRDQVPVCQMPNESLCLQCGTFATRAHEGIGGFGNVSAAASGAVDNGPASQIAALSCALAADGLPFSGFVSAAVDKNPSAVNRSSLRKAERPRLIIPRALSNEGVPERSCSRKRGLVGLGRFQVPRLHMAVAADLFRDRAQGRPRTHDCRRSRLSKSRRAAPRSRAISLRSVRRSAV